jgi:hypothetical protein
MGKHWCSGIKIRHATLASAEAHVAERLLLGRSRPGILHAYFCDVCQAFHTGHTRHPADVPLGRKRGLGVDTAKAPLVPLGSEESRP